MKNVIITGASGMVGNIILQHCLKSDEINKIISIVRRKSENTHPKLEEIIHKDFSNYDGLEDKFENIDIAFFCIGVYSGAVSDEKFKEITVDYTKVFADKLKEFSPNVCFCFLSGSGADQKEKSKVAFAKYKGMAENYLQSKNFGSFHSFRPGYIYPVEKRVEPNLMYRVSRSLYPVLKIMGKNFSIKSTELGEAMFKTGIKGTDKVILENKDILEIIA